jgi:hypothetical protein
VISDEGWKYMIVVKAMDTTIGLLAEGDRRSEIEAAILDAWDWCLLDASAEPPQVVLTVQLAQAQASIAAPAVIVRPSLPELMSAISQRVTVEAITAQAGQLVMLHACGLANPETGAVVALVGRSGMGKTTLASVLGHSLAYVTDETLAIRSDFSVAEFAKPLSVKRSPSDGVKDQRSPGFFDLRRADAPLWLSAIVLLDRTPDHAGKPVLRNVPLLPGIIKMTPETSYLARVLWPLQTMASIVNRVNGVKSLTYREAASAAPMIKELVGAS